MGGTAVRDAHGSALQELGFEAVQETGEEGVTVCEHPGVEGHIDVRRTGGGHLFGRADYWREPGVDPLLLGPLKVRT